MCKQRHIHNCHIVHDYPLKYGSDIVAIATCTDITYSYSGIISIYKLGILHIQANMSNTNAKIYHKSTHASKTTHTCRYHTYNIKTSIDTNVPVTINTDTYPLVYR